MSVEILGYHGSEYEDYGRVGRGAVWVGQLFSWFQRDVHLRLFCRTVCFRNKSTVENCYVCTDEIYASTFI